MAHGICSAVDLFCSDADDLVQITDEQVFLSWRTLRDARAGRTRLFRIARNAAVDPRKLMKEEGAMRSRIRLGSLVLLSFWTMASTVWCDERQVETPAKAPTSYTNHLANEKGPYLQLHAALIVSDLLRAGATGIGMIVVVSRLTGTNAAGDPFTTDGRAVILTTAHAR